MPERELLPPPRRARLAESLRRFLLASRLGRLLLLLLALRLLELLGLGLPSPLGSLVAVGLWIYALVLLFWMLGRLRAKLLWKIRRKLIISYLLIGLVPTVLILFFFLLSAYFIFGQVSSYVLSTSLERTEMEAAQAAETALARIERALDRERSSLTEEEIEAILEDARQRLLDPYPGVGASYFEAGDARLRRRVVVGPLAGADLKGRLPSWAELEYRGLIDLNGRRLVGGLTPPAPSGARVLVTLPLDEVLGKIAAETEFRIEQVLTGAGTQTPFEPFPAPAKGLGSPDSPFLIRWLALARIRSWDEAPSGEPEIIFFQIGFSFLSLYRVITTNALQLGPDLGRAILAALGILAALFLVIEVVAILVGLMLARSITGSVHELSQGTEHVRRGDFHYKIGVRSRDQLGELAESFNLMTTSIRELLRQSAEKERLEEELRIAREIQMSLLPKDEIRLPGVTIAALCLPATEVGGDYYDFIPIGEDRLALLIADVSGKGTSAALYMAELKGLMLSLSKIYDSPRKILIEANDILSANLDSRSFITMAYAVIDMGEKKMTFARAGHNPILQLSLNGLPRTRVLAPEGLGLALDRTGRFGQLLSEESVPLRSQDLFLFFTDGLSEAMNPRADLFGEARLRDLLERHSHLPLEELREKIFDEIFSFAEGEAQHDDMTMVLVKVL